VTQVSPSSVLVDNYQYHLTFLGSDFVGLPFGQNYKMKFTHDDGSIVNQTCTILNDTSLSCLSPSFANNGNISLALSVNDIDFVSIPLKLFLVKKSDINVGGYGNGVLKSSNKFDILMSFTNNFAVSKFASLQTFTVKLYDEYFNLNLQATLNSILSANSIQLLTTVENLWENNIEFPRKLTASLSFDGIHYFGSVSLIVKGMFDTYNQQKNMRISRSYYPINADIKVFIDYLPFKYDETQLILTDVTNSSNVLVYKELSLGNHFFSSVNLMVAGNFSAQLYHLKAMKIIPLKLQNIEGFRKY
jgi:hypothetical protein